MYSALELQSERVNRIARVISSRFLLLRFGFFKSRLRKVVFIFEFETREIFMS